MSKVKTKKNSGFEFNDWMKIFKTNLSQFVDQPTEENLKSLMKIAESYKDDWIKMASQDGGLGDRKPSTILSKEFLNNSDIGIDTYEFSEIKEIDKRPIPESFEIASELHAHRSSEYGMYR